jgi:hypothetical protein
MLNCWVDRAWRERPWLEIGGRASSLQLAGVMEGIDHVGENRNVGLFIWFAISLTDLAHIRCNILQPTMIEFYGLNQNCTRCELYPQIKYGGSCT